MVGTLVLTTTLTMTLPPACPGMLAPVEAMGEGKNATSTRAEDLKTIQKSLNPKFSGNASRTSKISPEQIDARLSRLSDAQLHQTASRIKSINPGGDAGGLLITVLLVAILVGIFFYVFRRI
ncbi:MAG: PA2779 family protein [Elusimicrobia bacterium]|nr:PA2779 family protein [Elusimicrobiota bacterium]